ncbi:hypothetical protein ODZ83_05395 [Acaricomes phytoseiuli]|uniref:hypothetical protein n=1 Tax=Acaricomes phytoseiuli TaxID=291968 RepID=UPI00036497C4|nr:hypothetical protein [Acaricomes phytoseiuli]MCW1249625.1 hypothetical protein [Acaricomes phytoseiuli]
MVQQQKELKEQPGYEQATPQCRTAVLPISILRDAESKKITDITSFNAAKAELSGTTAAELDSAFMTAEAAAETATQAPEGNAAPAVVDITLQPITDWMNANCQRLCR